MPNPTIPRCIAFLAGLMLLHGTAAAIAAATPQQRFNEFGASGAMLVRHGDGRLEVLHGPDLVDEQRIPASSIKPLIALIALETGALTDTSELVPWNGRDYPNFPEWQQPMALDQAMRTSSESYFLTLATRIGRDTLAQWIARVGYGNGEVGPRADKSWHDGVLLISAAQQLDFIERLRTGDLPFSAAHLEGVHAAMRSHHHGATQFFGKTGTHLGGNDGNGTGWWVGWTEGDAGGFSFALMVDLQRFDGRERRLRLADQLLVDAGLLEKVSEPAPR
jgi:beta-lactamase class D